MSKSPFLNAIAAIVYIAVVVSGVFYGPRLISPSETILLPIIFLSVFVLSAAVMTYLFLYQPLRLFLEGEKGAAVRLFISTVGIFAIFIVILLVFLYLQNTGSALLT